MARTSFLYDADDHALLAIRLGLVLLDNSPALQVELPPRRKSDQKSKALAPAMLSPRRKPGRKTKASDGPHQA